MRRTDLKSEKDLLEKWEDLNPNMEGLCWEKEVNLTTYSHGTTYRFKIWNFIFNSFLFINIFHLVKLSKILCSRINLLELVDPVKKGVENSRASLSNFERTVSTAVAFIEFNHDIIIFISVSLTKSKQFFKKLKRADIFYSQIYFFFFF